jgi:preprotein translocase subunit SecE
MASTSSIGEDMTTEVRGQRDSKPARSSGPARQPERTTPAVFVREVRSELRKVIWPTRKELGTYTTVAVVFILVMVAIVVSIDLGFSNLVFDVFK